MRRAPKLLILVALIVLGGVAVRWIRQQGTDTGLERNGTAQGTPDLSSPGTSPSEASRKTSPSRGADPKASLIIRLRSLGKPVAGISFTVLEEATHRQEKFATGPDGAHAILGLPGGEYHIAVDHPDYVYATAHKMVVADKAHEVAIELDAGARVEGKVTDDAGRPLEGVHVIFLDPKTRGPIGHNLKADTDASGNYRILSIPVGLFEVQFRKTGYRGGRRENFAVTGKGQEFRLDMTLRTGRSITGIVVSQDGIPIPGATVVGTNDETATCRSDEKGAFTLSGLGDDPAHCFASAAGYGAVYLKALAPGSTGVEFRLAKAGEILGRIDSRPVPGEFTVRVSRFEPEAGKFVPMYTRTFEGASGEDFRMSELPMGRYRLEVEARGYETQDAPELELSAGQSLTGVQVRLRKKS